MGYSSVGAIWAAPMAGSLVPWKVWAQVVGSQFVMAGFLKAQCKLRAYSLVAVGHLP